ncbi:MAG: hypothetical protein WBG63_18480 [Phormidesmis sp.]
MLHFVEILKRKLSERAGVPFSDILSDHINAAALKDVNVTYRKLLFTVSDAMGVSALLNYEDESTGNRDIPKLEVVNQ